MQKTTKKDNSLTRNNASFKDPDGFVFSRGSVLYRQINLTYKKDYDFLIKSGLHKNLTENIMLVSHQEVSLNFAVSPDAYKILKPEIIPFISYPHEWCFSQLKEAALLTLDIQKKALDFGMSLKDASAYNIQFKGVKPVMIDESSFEIYSPGKPWIAYRQFCQHFLAPLSLMTYKDVRLGLLMTNFIDGIPLDLAAHLLPIKTKFNLGILGHIYFHSKSQKHYADKNIDKTKYSLDLKGLKALIDHLYHTVSSLKLKNLKTEWGDYYNFTNYSQSAFKQKKAIVSGYLTVLKPNTVIDMGSNNGEFSRLVSKKNSYCISADSDLLAIERNFHYLKQNGYKNILPLLIDLTNPSPGIGWKNQERDSFTKRACADTVMALAVVHHLAISNNLPLSNIAEYFSDIAKSVIVEFVPKQDSQVKKLLSTREDVFPKYTRKGFEMAFKKYFNIMESEPVPGTDRIIYMMKRK